MFTYSHTRSYESPPLDNVTLEEFESWAIDRLRGTCLPRYVLCKLTILIGYILVLAEIEAAHIRNLPQGIKQVVDAQCEKYLQLHSTGESNADLDAERKKDHVSHFILRLAFCRSCVSDRYRVAPQVLTQLTHCSEDLRQKFVKAEGDLFKIRLQDEDPKARAAFLSSKRFGGEPISEDDKRLYKIQLMAATQALKSDADFEKEVFYRASHCLSPPKNKQLMKFAGSLD